MYPWEVYTRYGDIGSLRENYDIMKNTIDFLAEGRVGGLLPTPIGDWHDAVKADLDIAIRRERGLERDDTWGSIQGGYPVHTPRRVCGTVHLWLAADALSKIADLLGHPDDAAKYRKLAGELVEAFNRTYLKPADGRCSYTTPKGNTYESQTMYGYALYHGLVPENLRVETTRRFLEHIAEYQNHFTSGQLGTDRVLKVLTVSGQEQAAFDILTANWKCDGKVFEWTIVVPPNTSATLSVPCAADEVEMVEGVAGVVSKKAPSAGRQEIEVGAGTYRMKSKI